MMEENLPQTILKELSPKHKQVCALIAQGVDRRLIAAAVDITPEYVTMLQRQPLVRAYIKEMNEAVGLRLEAMFEQSVDVIAEQMQSGNGNEKLAAARLQLEATKRIGRVQADQSLPQEADRLERLAQRLEGLLHVHKGVTINGESETIIE